MDPRKVDENTEFFESRVVPTITASTGFRGLLDAVDRTTGEGIVGTVWDDAGALGAAALDAQATVEEAVARGVHFAEMSVREVLLVEMK